MLILLTGLLMYSFWEHNVSVSFSYDSPKTNLMSLWSARVTEEEQILRVKIMIATLK